MDITQKILELAFYVLPAILCIVVTIIVLKLFLAREEQREAAALRQQAFASILQLRIAAYERITLYLERIRPNNLLYRLEPASKNAKALYEDLLLTIRSEFEHNIVQQIYVSQRTWYKLLEAKNGLVHVIEEAYKKIPPNSQGTKLAEMILALIREKNDNTLAECLELIRHDVLSLFQEEKD
ncbi:MAG: hypothetical protein RML72_02430 [Bacteroidia bacterium]|nr:hypothetical protein [Bacteroidia bacterium]MDW8157717.1 hypothetical protein [Bacteroidia bacterium]